MKVKDKRAKPTTPVLFKELSIGQAYEDRDGVLCIKTDDAERGANCIYFLNDTWTADNEEFYVEVTPLITTLEIVK